MASKNKVLEIIGAIKTIYPYYAKETSVELLVNTWQILFNEYTDKELEVAFVQCLKICKVPPTPADVIEQINEMRTADTPTDEELWNSFLKALRQAERYIYDFGFTFVEANGKTQGQNARERFEKLWESLPEDIKQFVGGKGELIRMARADDEELKFERNRFFKTIPAIRKRKEFSKMRKLIDGNKALPERQTLEKLSN